MSPLVWIGVASFGYVFLRAFQQLNVVNNAYLLVLVTSQFMALGDVFLVTKYAASGGVSLPLVVTVGCSSGFGSVAAMWIRKKLTSRRG